MNKIIETKRLILRPFVETDADDVFAFSTNLDVMKYTGDKLLSHKEEALRIITDTWFTDYKKYGYGRFAVEHKVDRRVIGFSGLKFETAIGMTDIGYRFLPEYWGKGIATESCLPFIEWGFEELNIDKIMGLAYPENIASCKVLQKIGLSFIKTEPFPGEKKQCNWYGLSKSDYSKNK